MNISETCLASSFSLLHQIFFFKYVSNSRRAPIINDGSKHWAAIFSQRLEKKTFHAAHLPHEMKWDYLHGSQPLEVKFLLKAHNFFSQLVFAFFTAWRNGAGLARQAVDAVSSGLCLFNISLLPYTAPLSLARPNDEMAHLWGGKWTRGHRAENGDTMVVALANHKTGYGRSADG